MRGAILSKHGCGGQSRNRQAIRTRDCKPGRFLDHRETPVPAKSRSGRRHHPRRQNRHRRPPASCRFDSADHAGHTYVAICGLGGGSRRPLQRLGILKTILETRCSSESVGLWCVCAHTQPALAEHRRLSIDSGPSHALTKSSVDRHQSPDFRLPSNAVHTTVSCLLPTLPKLCVSL